MTATDRPRTLPAHLRTATADAPREMGYWEAHKQREQHEAAGDAAEARRWQDVLDRWHFLPLGG